MLIGIELFAFPYADHDADVAEEPVHEQQDEIHDAPFQGHKLERGGNDAGGHESEDESEDTADNDF